MSSSVDFIVGNSYSKLPKHNANYDKSGTYRKIHDWTLFLDIIDGSPEIIEKVQFDLGSSFSPSSFTCACPIQLKKPNGKTAWRFKTRQQTYGPITATVSIRGRGGTLKKTTHRTLLAANSEHLKAPVQEFVEVKPLRPLRPLKLNDSQKFGIELELTSDNYVTEDMIADLINENRNSISNDAYVEVIRNYSQGKSTSIDWKLVPDSSIMCSTSSPDCNKFELVSPILMGGSGLSQINKILKQLTAVQPKLKVNKSMGYHVHIDVDTYSHDQLVKICQNFIKYEDAIDTFMPRSRRTGSGESNMFFKSNSQSIADQLNGRIRTTNRMCHDALENTDGDLHELVQLMNSSGRYYKLNLQNLATGRQPTIEFRQHSATVNYDKVSYWIRFCVAFCSNSAKLAPPTPFAENRSVEYKINALFQYVIKDQALRDFYYERCDHLSHDEGDAPCCTECVSGGRCASKRQRNSGELYEY